MTKGKKVILITIFTGVIGNVLAAIIISILEEVNFIEAIIKLINWIYNILKKILFFKIPLGIILISILVFIIIKYFISKYSKKYYSKPWYSDYTKDSYKNVLYTWNYDAYSTNIKIIDFRPICETCDGELTMVDKYKHSYFSSPKLYCPNCDMVLNTPSSEEVNQAKVFVYNNLKKKINNLQSKD